MTTVTLANATDLSNETYIVLGLATCFLKADGEVHEVLVAEPVPSAALEAILKQIPTSYQLMVATTIGVLCQEQTFHLPEAFPVETQFCDDFEERLIAAARTYQARPASQELIPVGVVYRDLNYSLERKRVLNSDRIVKTEDNVKQHAYTHQVL
jgi:hypothetical protein